MVCLFFLLFPHLFLLIYAPRRLHCKDILLFTSRVLVQLESVSMITEAMLLLLFTFTLRVILQLQLLH